MMSATWLPPLNSHENYKIIILAAQFKEATNNPSSSEQHFLIRVDFDVSFYSNSDKMALKGLSLNNYFSFSCRSLTSSLSRAKRVISYIRSEMHIPFQLDNIFFTHRHFKRSYGSRSCFKLLPEDGNSWVEKLQKFLRSMKHESYNACCNVLPLNLKIKKNVWISDDEFLAWSTWYHEKKRVDPSFQMVYQAAVQRPRTVQELLDEANLKFKAADESSLAALEDARLDNDCSSTMQCLICLEYLSLGSKASCLPCLHVFHKTCITKWLQESNKCPLCRFTLPSV